VRRLAAALLLVPLVLLPGSPAHAEEGVTSLHGTLVLDPVACTGGHPVGSYVLMAAGGKAFRNRTPNCGDGTATLLPPGRHGLALDRFVDDPAPAFDAHGNARAADVITPVRYDGHSLGLATSSRDVQDAPYGPATLPAPEARTQAGVLVVDLRALHVTYDGHPSSTCTSAQGHGCWLVGSKSAQGTYDATTRAFTVEWTAGQGFAGPSAAVVFHLEGHLVPDAATGPATGTRGNAPRSVAAAPQPASGAAGTKIREAAGPDADHIHQSHPDRELVLPGLAASVLLALLLVAHAYAPRRRD
jgi:hypothetical protein